MPSISFTEPDMTYHDSSDDSIRRLTDDYGRHRLTDLMEADESEEDGLDYLRYSPRRKRYSSIGSTASSMDGLWDLHPRRLSEAGLSRHSDSSAVLTEDTDSFIIGQRVWVGGTKPGTIAYIGETQFAPGDWAGIALDEPIGKNDGSVAGIRYFQCENKKGVFSRLTRLTRVPLEQPGMGSNETFTSPSNGVRRSPISPTGSTKSLLKSPTLSTSNTSLTSSAHVDFKIGDRVIIKSTQGSKVGTVRYMGLTDFAPGEWVGVELDDPRGKNDGSVEGKRYFECRPHFGLFAPISKVSKSPSKVKPGACIVHSSGPGLPPSGLMRRAGSKESMNSMASKTSAASSSIRRDVLREKQQHIEQLLKERDLERAEITRAASQADDAEQRLFTLKQEFEQYRLQCELQAREHSELLARLKADREELLSQLEDEKRKNEDLQFRFEEAAISKGDIEENILVQSATNDAYLRKIKDLEQNLLEERQKAENVEGISNKLFEAEESLIKAREEIDNLKIDLEEITKKKSVLEDEKTVSAQLIESLQKQYNGVITEKEEKEQTINQLKENISKLTSEHEVLKKQVEEYRVRLDENCAKKDSEIETLNVKLTHADELLKEKLILLEKLEKTNEELIKENGKLKMEISAKSLDLENAVEKLAQKEEEHKSIQEQRSADNSELYQKVVDLERHRDNLLEVEGTLRKELEEIHENLQIKISELADFKKERDIELAQKDMKFDEILKTIKQKEEEVNKLSEDIVERDKKFKEDMEEILTKHAKQIEEKDSQLTAMSAEIQEKNKEVVRLSTMISKLEEDVCSKNSIIETLRLELESLKNEHSKTMEASTALDQKLQNLELNHGDVQRQLSLAQERIVALTETKQRLENDVQSLTANLKGESAAQLEQLRKELQAKEHSIDTIKTEFSEKLQISERGRHELDLKYQHVVTDFEKLKSDLEEKLRVSTQSEALLKERYDNSLAEMAKIRDEYGTKINELEHSLQEKDLALSSSQSKCSETEKYYQEQLKGATEELNRNLISSQGKINSLSDEIQQLKEQLAKKSEEIIEANAKSSHILAQQEQTENELKQKHGEDIKRLEFELNEKTTLLEKAQTEISLLKNDCQNSSTDLSAKENRITELTTEAQKAKDLINHLQEELASTRLEHQQSTRQHEEVQNQCKGLIDQVTALTEQVRSGETIFSELKKEHYNLKKVLNELTITKQQKQECLQKLENEFRNAGEPNCSVIEDILNKVKVDNNDQNAEILALQKDLDILKSQLAERTHQFDIQKGEILRLQEELLKTQQASVTFRGPPEQNSLIEDKEMAENQIKFLNSIIVDITKKNEEQKARIEILESGYSPAMADELKLIGLPQQHQLTPRMYCDICEEFDLHETEDCPQQTTDLAPSNLSKGNKPQQERPYCEICEVFGHSTEECPEDQMF